MKVFKDQKIALDKIVIDHARNVRDEVAYKPAELQALKDDLAFRGQQVVAVLEKRADGKYEPLQGFLRATALTDLAKEGKIDPLTMKLDSDGNPVAGTGKVFGTINAVVYEDLNDKERISLLFDHSQRRGLSRAETQLALEKLFTALYPEIDVVIMTRNLLEQWYPPTRAIKKLKDSDGRDTDRDDPNDLLNYFRGVIQTAKIAWRAPVLLRDAWLEKLREHQKWPRKSELLEGAKIYDNECKADITMKFSREKPGPKFMEWWDRFAKASKEAEEKGETRGKTTSMLTRSQIEDCQKVADSRIIKALLSIVLNNGRVDREKLGVLDTLLKNVEAGFTPDESKILDSVFTKPATVQA